MSEAPPPSYEEAQAMTQPPYPPQNQFYQGPKVDGYSGNPPYPAQPAPYPTQQGYPQQSYPYQQPAPPQGNYPPGTYVHPTTVGYSPGQGVIVGQNQGPVTGFVTGGGPMDAGQQRRRKIILGVVMSLVIFFIVIIFLNIIF